MDREKVISLIQHKNDSFRKNILYLAAKVNRNHLHITPTVGHTISQEENMVYELLDLVMNLPSSVFDDNNDPWFEHDMAFFTFRGERFFFKISYYKDSTFECHPDTENDKLSDEKCFRVLTIGEMSDY